MGMAVDLTFPTRYKAEHLLTLPSEAQEERRFYFPPTETPDRGPNLLVKVIPDTGEPWLGSFAPGYDSPKSVTGIYAYPDGMSLCGISQGKGCVIRSDNPHNWRGVDTHPILSVITIAAEHLLLFVDFTTISAYGQSGLVWKTPRLSWDGLTITEVTTNHVRGLAWDSPEDREVEFLVDIKTGHHKGGSSPEQYAKVVLQK
jgi:hypothetical protein